jgi:hypothetical protein
MPKKANRGSFRPGPDPRRHAFTRAERRRGYRNAMAATLGRDIHVHAWLFRRVRGYYRARRREAG